MFQREIHLLVLEVLRRGCECVFFGIRGAVERDIVVVAHSMMGGGMRGGEGGRSALVMRRMVEEGAKAGGDGEN